jgi:hypothetical protein
VTYLLLLDCSNVGVRGVRYQGGICSWERVYQRYPGNQGCLCGGESGIHRLQLGEYLGATCKRGGEWPESFKHSREETAVEVNHTQEPLQYFAVTLFREIQNDLNIVLERGDAGGRDAVSQVVEFATANTPFSRLRASPLAARMVKRVRKCSQCCSLV